MATFPELPHSFRHMTITSGLRASSARAPSKIAVVCGDVFVTYSELFANVCRVGNVARELYGVRPGDHVAIVSPNSVRYLELVCGLSNIGAAVATPSPRLTQTELKAILDDCCARVVFVHPEYEDLVDSKCLTSAPTVVQLDAHFDAKIARAAQTDPSIPTFEWAPFAIPYTSGTTGKPKGVVLSHRSRTLGFLAYASEYGIYSPDDRFLAFAPMCHGAGFAFAMASLYFGGTTEVLPKFDPELVLRAIHSGKVTGLFTVPTHFHAIFELSASVLAANRSHRLRGIVSNAAPLDQILKERIVDYFGAGLLHETYGSTEAGVVTNLRPEDQLRKQKCVGVPFLGTRIRLLATDGSEVPVGEVGELHSSSPYLFNGYWNRPEETLEAFRDGWVTVGDMARRDGEGYYYIVDRKKDMVISGGINIYPREIEAVLNEHPQVLESAVIGVDDHQWGERLIAYIVAKGGRPTLKSMSIFCQGRLAKYKVPSEIRYIGCIPRNAAGKVLKTELRVAYQAESQSTTTSRLLKED